MMFDYSNAKHLNGLIGKQVTGLFVSQGEGDLKFTLQDPTDNPVLVSAAGDCCSETWFADIVGVANLIGGVVASVEDLQGLPDVDDNRTRQEVDQVYGVRVKTEKGDCDIIFRNSSNGYYGGELTPFYSDYREPREWREITEDWQA
jgi:hypothetical protein